MTKLTTREEEIMQYFWTKGELYVKDILEMHPEPKPHFNTISTIVRGLESKGFLDFKSQGNTHQYYPIISEKEYGSKNLKNIANKYFNNSAFAMVSALVKEEDISEKELRELIEIVKSKKS